jgi:hypothetical protein
MDTKKQGQTLFTRMLIAFKWEERHAKDCENCYSGLSLSCHTEGNCRQMVFRDDEDRTQYLS